MTVKLVAERGTGRLLGGQIVGEDRAAKRIDTIATALHARMRVDELIDLDLAYAPPFSTHLGPDPPGRPAAGRRALGRRRTWQTAAWHCRPAGPPSRPTAPSSGAPCAGAYSDLVDGWLAELLAAAEAECGAGGVALVAVGGYGRAELSLQSDIDVVLLHAGRSDIGTLADRIWYPIWDEGLKLGHAVRTTREALALAADDLDTATSLLQVRHVAGDEDLTDDLSPTGHRAVAEARQALARRPLPARAPAPRDGRGGRVPARARSEGGPGRPARRARAALGGSGPQPALAG